MIQIRLKRTKVCKEFLSKVAQDTKKRIINRDVDNSVDNSMDKH